MKKILLLPFMIITLFANSPVKDMWWTYMTDYPEGPALLSINLALKEKSPNADYPYVIVTGVRYKIKKESKLPEISEIDFLYELGQRRLRVVEKLTKCIYAGTFTHNGERLDYIYVQNTTGIKKALDQFYVKEKISNPYINIKDDKKWEDYNLFLFPNKEIIEFYRDELQKIGFLKKSKQ